MAVWQQRGRIAAGRPRRRGRAAAGHPVQDGEVTAPAANEGKRLPEHSSVSLQARRDR